MPDDLPLDAYPLNAYLEAYYQERLNKKELEGLIFEFILKHHKQFGLAKWRRDEYLDYVCWLYPRLSRAIDNYQDAGSSFDAYIGTIVRLSAREYHFREIDHHIAERTYWNDSALEMHVHNQEPEYAESNPPVKPVANPRQALLLLLKSYYFVSEDFIARAAPAIGVRKETLIRMIDELRNLRCERDAEIRRLQDRLHTQYFRRITFEKRMHTAAPGSHRHEIMKKRMERAQKKIAILRKRLKSVRAVASNRQIAEVLGVSKGTVDSNLYAVKMKHHQGRLEDRINHDCDDNSGETASLIPVSKN